MSVLILLSIAVVSLKEESFQLLLLSHEGPSKSSGRGRPRK
jgi:hypothetical protein